MLFFQVFLYCIDNNAVVFISFQAVIQICENLDIDKHNYKIGLSRVSISLLSCLGMREVSIQHAYITNLARHTFFPMSIMSLLSYSPWTWLKFSSCDHDWVQGYFWHIQW